MHKEKKNNNLPSPGEVACMTQCSFTRLDIEFAVKPCRLQGLLYLNQTQFEMSLKLCFLIRECLGSENLPIISKMLSTKIIPLYIARGTERSSRLAAPVLLASLFPIHSHTLKHSGRLSGMCLEKSYFFDRKLSFVSPV